MNFPLIKQRHPSGMPEKRAVARPGRTLHHPYGGAWAFFVSPAAADYVAILGMPRSEARYGCHRLGSSIET